MSSDTTSIFDFPTDPAGGGNISMSINEKMPMNPQYSATVNTGTNAGTNMTLDQTTINQIVSGIQQAGAITQLPSRDIPMNTDSLMQDPSIQPNYIPPASNRDYVAMQPDNDDIINEYHQSSKRINTLDEVYDQLQTPLLLAVLYFLFQLPVFRKSLFKYFPFLFSSDGNSNLQGLLFTSGLYGLVYFITSRIMINFNKF